MIRHEGVSCDSCLNGNFRGKRWKCLVCFDYDLCSVCYEAGATSIRHTTQHPMQCILTRSDLELYYSGEAFNSDQPQSFTCPYCGKFGFSDSALLDHVNAEHANADHEIVCPICASLPYGYPNLVTENFAEHLTVEHRSPTRDLASFLDETSTRHSNRTTPAPTSRNITTRPRRSNLNFATGSLASLTPSSPSREIDPITELLSQLSGVRRTQGSAASQYMDLQMQFQRQQVRPTSGQQLVRVTRRSQQHANPTSGSANLPSNAASSDSRHNNSQTFLLPSLLGKNLEENDLSLLDENRANRALFVHDIILGCLKEPFNYFYDILSFLPVADKGDVKGTTDSGGNVEANKISL